MTIPVKYECDIQYLTSVLIEVKNQEINGTEEIGLVTCKSKIAFKMRIYLLQSLKQFSIFRVDIMVADDIAPSITRASAAIVLVM